MPKTSRTSTASMPQSERASAKPLACARKVRATIVVAIAIVAGEVAVAAPAAAIVEVKAAMAAATAAVVVAASGGKFSRRQSLDRAAENAALLCWRIVR